MAKRIVHALKVIDVHGHDRERFVSILPAQQNVLHRPAIGQPGQHVGLRLLVEFADLFLQQGGAEQQRSANLPAFE